MTRADRDELVYPREYTLSKITLVLGILFWALMLVGTFGIMLLYVLIGYVLYLFAQSALIAHIKGNGVEVTSAQFPDLHAQFVSCCQTLQINGYPQVYVLQGGGMMNAFAARFLGLQYVVLLSDVVDAMAEHPDGVRFYLGHELGHLRMRHIGKHFLRWPALWLPLLGAAYSRAKESTCDRHGAACSTTPENAARALAALAAGCARWKDINLDSYARQVSETGGFWMSFHELTGGYPWLTKRVARVMEHKPSLPRRNRWAGVLAAMVPYSGRIGGAGVVILYFYIVIFILTIGLPIYRDQLPRLHGHLMFSETAMTRSALEDYYINNHDVPSSLAEIGQKEHLNNGDTLALDEHNMTITVTSHNKSMLITPRINKQKHISWYCTPGTGMRAAQMPATCMNGGH
ncbi:M48 family metallopeptidase [Komagataeibacter xylinus]|uniref:M48 family metallopeptidase n=1 Tax=Komagataeibacter xylinus TaxID=28448 RepID=A0A857FTI4_KOMXY|nr:M48 family metallopeptidase [Komagataeibacter xylinus]QHC36490.1 M48 family metallopeptidase [Komagataeibacter xylinus]